MAPSVTVRGITHQEIDDLFGEEVSGFGRHRNRVGENIVHHRHAGADGGGRGA